MLYWINMFYCAVAAIVLIVSLVNKPKDAKNTFRFSACVFGAMMMLITAIAVVMVGLKLSQINQKYSWDRKAAWEDALFIILLFCTSAFFFICPLLHGPKELLHIVATMFQYFFMLPFL